MLGILGSNQQMKINNIFRTRTFFPLTVGFFPCDFNITNKLSSNRETIFIEL